MTKPVFQYVTNKFIMAFSAVVILVCLALYISFYAIDGPSFQQGQERASELIAALEQYKRDSGEYPSNLCLLVPDYLSIIPRPAWRYKYGYYTYGPHSHPTEYRIDFRLKKSADDWGCYSSETKKWQRYDSYCQ